MSKPVRKITIAGFRGIPGTFELDFNKGNSNRSIVIHGRNGTGKSSIADACEWFYTGTIEALRRRGAGAKAYSHREPISASTYVEFSFSDNDIEDVRVTLDRSAPTNDRSIKGDLLAFKEVAPHPFYVRFSDLKNFVFETQANKYDKLAGLMGFEPQVAFQESLRTVLRQLEQKVSSQEGNVESLRENLRNHLDTTATSDTAILSAATEPLVRQNLDNPSKIDDLRRAREKLATRVQNDPTADAIAKLKNVLVQVTKIIDLNEFEPLISDFLNDLQDFAHEQEVAPSALLLKVYKAGSEFIKDAYQEEENVGECPLCGQVYDGDLREHVSDELAQLKELKGAIEDLEDKQEEAVTKLRAVRREVKGVQSYTLDLDEEEVNEALGKLQSKLQSLDGKLEGLIGSIREVEVENASDHARSLNSTLQPLTSGVEGVKRVAVELKKLAQSRKEALAQDEAKLALADDHSWIVSTLEKRDMLRTASEKKGAMAQTEESFRRVVDDYISYNSRDVERRFEDISGDVKTFFEILERDTEGLGDPKIELTGGSVRGVFLKVRFHGQDEHPAYKYLSESQLNSFGLAVFLASVIRFNSDFPFVVLDDVINSFDAYKRTKLIDILSRHLGEFQVLVLTHDEVWMRQISDHFRQWKSIRFKDWTYQSGPITGSPEVGLDYIKNLLDDDRGREAGGLLGPFLENKLQELCEDFKVKVPYNRRNTYTLNDFFQAFRKRIRDKLKTGHDLYIAIDDAFQKQAFRNFCSHWKNESVPVQTSEIREVVGIWDQIDDILRCKQCRRYVQYDSKSFVCVCGEHKLTKA